MVLGSVVQPSTRRRPVNAATVRVANAPVNFGIYQASSAPIAARELLAELAAVGYDGVDSGPIGYISADDLLQTRMGLAGGWVDLRYSDASGFAADLTALRAALAAFTAIAVDDPRWRPRPTLACPSNPARFARPGGLTPGLSDEAWPGFAARVQAAADLCRTAGLEPAFHPHLGTDVETPADIERILELTDVGICLDTGHLWLAGGNPVAALRDWSDRIRQIHIKDADSEILASAGDLDSAVAAGCFRALGRGEVDIAGFVATLRDAAYEGWIVVEQDAPATGQDLDAILADQRANREFLRSVGW
jgi:inosose dehydratase